MPTATLYAFPFSCSFAVQLVLAEHGQPVERVPVQRGTARKVAGDFDRVNPKRKVPTLEWEGQTRTEIVAILHSLDGRFVPERSEEDRVRHLEWCAFLATELHQQVLGPLFDPATPDAARQDALQRLLPPVLAHLEASIGQGTLLGGEPSGADAYLFWGLLLLRFGNQALPPGLQAFHDRMLARPAVRALVVSERATRRV